ncbi:MAG: ATPase, T2SS/T4P/T4SS family [Candidatus Diapherotrites archaeon]
MDCVAGKVLGWNLTKTGNGEVRKTIRSSGCYEIIELRSGEMLFVLSGLPRLSVQEAVLVRDFLEEFREANSKKASHKMIESVLLDFCSKKMIGLDEEQRDYILKALNLEVFGFGPLTELLQEESLEEIAVTGLGEEKPVRVYHNAFGWLKTNLYYSSELAVRNAANKMARGIGRRLSLQAPKLNAVLPDGSRLNACMEPVSFLGPSLTIRKFRKKPFTPKELFENKTVSAEALAFLSMALQTDCSLVIAGNTGSGKTSTLNALFHFVPRNERIIAVEETPEILLPHGHIVKLNTAEELGIGMHELIVESLRMRPDRIIVGEVRSQKELNAFIDTLLAGQGKGSYCTFHAQSAQEALTRMQKLSAHQMDLASIDLILVQKRWNSIGKNRSTSTEQRRVVELSEVIADSEGSPKLNCLFEFDYSKDSLVKKNESSRVKEKIMRSFRFGAEEFQRQLNAEERKIKAKKAGDAPGN